MAGLFGTQATANTTNAPGDISKDVAINSPPEDSIAGIRFSPTADFLAVASWDKKVRIYQVGNDGSSEGKAAIDFDGPALACAWSEDGSKVVGVSADKTFKMLDLQSGNMTPQSLVAHDEPIRCVTFTNIQNTSVLVTGSWDKKVKYWDLRSDKPVVTVENQERVYTMDAQGKLLVIGTADRYINIIDLNKPDSFYKTIQSPLKFQTRVISCFTPNPNGFAIGSIEGRCAIQYVEERDAANNFSFKCHREQNPQNKEQSNVFSVNAISFHPEHGTFSTAGSDGQFNFWDGQAKHRLKGFPSAGAPITATAFNRQGNIFAYALSYDWSQGFQKNTQQQPHKIMLHAVNQDEVKPRPKAGAKR